MTLCTSENLDELKKILDIMRGYGVLSLEMGALKLTLGPDLGTGPAPTLLDDPETKLKNLREALEEQLENEEELLLYSV